MPVTWMSIPLIFSVEFSVGEVLDMLKKLEPDEIVQCTIELMLDLEPEQMREVEKWIEGGKY